MLFFDLMTYCITRFRKLRQVNRNFHNGDNTAQLVTTTNVVGSRRPTRFHLFSGATIYFRRSRVDEVPRGI